MDDLGIKSSDLAEAAGCSRNNISEIRTGKTNPPLNRFWELVEICDQLSPGFKRELAKRIAGVNSPIVCEPEKLLNEMDREELTEFLLALAQKVKSPKKNQQHQDFGKVKVS